MIALAEQAQGIMDAVECGLPLRHRVGGVVIAESVAQVVLERRSPSAIDWRGYRVGRRGKCLNGFAQSLSRPRQADPRSQPLAESPRAGWPPAPRRPCSIRSRSGRCDSRPRAARRRSRPWHRSAGQPARRRRARSIPVRWAVPVPPDSTRIDGSPRPSVPRPDSSAVQGPPTKPQSDRPQTNARIAVISLTIRRMRHLRRLALARSSSQDHRCIVCNHDLRMTKSRRILQPRSILPKLPTRSISTRLCGRSRK